MTPLGGEELATTRERDQAELDARADALRAFAPSDVPVLVAGAYAFFEYTGIFRDTKDLEVFLRRRDLEAAFDALSASGFRCEMLDEVWIAKAYRGDDPSVTGTDTVCCEPGVHSNFFGVT